MRAEGKSEVKHNEDSARQRSSTNTRLIPCGIMHVTSTTLEAGELEILLPRATILDLDNVSVRSQFKLPWPSVQVRTPRDTQ